MAHDTTTTHGNSPIQAIAMYVVIHTIILLIVYLYLKLNQSSDISPERELPLWFWKPKQSAQNIFLFSKQHSLWIQVYSGKTFYKVTLLYSIKGN